MRCGLNVGCVTDAAQLRRSRTVISQTQQTAVFCNFLHDFMILALTMAVQATPHASMVSLLLNSLIFQAAVHTLYCGDFFEKGGATRHQPLNRTIESNSLIIIIFCCCSCCCAAQPVRSCYSLLLCSTACVSRVTLLPGPKSYVGKLKRHAR